MKKNLIALVAACFLMLVSCGPSIKITGSWVNKEKIQPGKVKSVFIIVLTQNTNVKTIVEDDMAAEAEKRGYKAYKSYEYFKPNFTNENVPNKDAIMNKIKEIGCDAIVTSALINRETEERYVPGTTTYAPYPRFRHYGDYWGYYSRWYPTLYTPGYYTEDKIYFFESNLYDAATGDILWSIQSEAVNPPKIKEFSKQYVAALIKQLEKEGLMKK